MFPSWHRSASIFISYFLAHLSESDMVSFCDPFLSVVRPYVKIYFKCYIFINGLANFIQTSHECFFGSQLYKLFKKFNYMQNSGCHGNRKKNNLVIVYQVLLKKSPGVKIGPALGIHFFPVYVYCKNLKIFV
jgi:hypothetical protein